MPNPIIRVHNVETNEIVNREMTAAELAEFNAQKELDTQKEIERETRATARTSALAKLAALGLNADEIAAL
jgi:hypothetical protein